MGSDRSWKHCTRSVTSLAPIYVSGNGVRTAFIVPLTNTRNISEKEKRERSYNFNRLVMTVLNIYMYIYDQGARDAGR